ncbi:YadA-like family protein [Achromobacter pulmonis]|nr:YadA-like family protein [Achromobacter pulmonis]
MNKVYKCILNEATGKWVVASELAKGKKKRSSRALIAIAGALVASATSAETHYYSVNDGGTPAANYANDGATGADALAAGIGATASGEGSTAIGTETRASGYGSTALGFKSVAELAYDVAVGNGARAVGGQSSAFGPSAYASGTSSTAIGSAAQATNASSVAIGDSSLGSGFWSTAIGSHATASGYRSLAAGPEASATVAGGVALGSNSVSSTAAGVAPFIPPRTTAAQASAIAATTSTSGAVSVGDSTNGLYRQITGVAGGTADSDAVNVAQLKGAFASSQTHYYSVNDAGVAGGNYNNDGATGINALAGGVGATAGGRSGLAMGESSKASNNDTVAIGHNATAASANAAHTDMIAIGLNANASNDHALAIGFASVAKSANSAAVGANATASGDAASAFGHNATASGSSSTALGLGASASKGSAVALGNSANAAADNSTAIGYQAATSAVGTIAMGQGAKAQTGAANAIAIGSGAIASASAVNSLALGSAAVASVGDGVALGSGSLATTGASVQAYNPRTGMASTDAGAAWKSTLGAVSVGNAATGKTRQINGLAGGTQDTDAVNVAQLKASTADAVMYDGSTHNTVTLTGDAYDSSAKTGGTRIRNVARGVGDSDAVNMSQLNEANTQISNVDNRVTNVDNRVIGLENDALLWDPAVNGGAGAYSANHGGVGPSKITNVAAAELTDASTDAVNGSQLKATNEQVASIDNRVTTVEGDVTTIGDRIENVYNTGTKYFHANSTGIDSQAIGQDSVAIGMGAVASHDGSVALGAGSNASGATLGNQAYLVGGTASGEVNVGNRRITGLSAGADDSDAVNVAQLKQAAADSTADVVKYDNSTHNTVTLTGDAYDSSAKTGGTRIRNVARGVGDSDAVNMSQLNETNTQISNVDNRVTAVEGDVTTIGDRIENVYNTGTKYFHANSTGADSQAIGQDSVAIGMGAVASHDGSVALGAGSNASGATLGNQAYLVGGTASGEVNVGNRRITGLSAGADDSDAVNVAQLKQAAADSTADVVKYDNSTHSTITLTGNTYSSVTKTGGTRITNVAAGVDGGDAVNLDQLEAAKTRYYSVNDGGVIGANYANDGATGGNSLAAGVAAQSSATQSVALGYNAKAYSAQSVALGANSIANASLTASAYNPTALYTLAGLTPIGEVSVGSAGKERRITNVAAGAADTDAVNVSQLKSAVSAISANPPGNDRAVTYDGAAGAPKDKVTLQGTPSTDGGKTGGTIITNVKQGEVSKTSTDAVNGSQLYETNQRVENIDVRVSNVENKFVETFSSLDNGSRYFKADGTNTDADKATVQTGTSGVASGSNAAVSGKNGVAIGSNAVSAAEETVAVGAGATASASGATATGSGARASGKRSSAVGQKASASGNNSVAVGAGAKASNTNSVALGADSATDRDNSVSVGYAGGERQITNMAAGTAPTDGVNVSQLNDTKNDIVNYTNGKLRNLRNDANAGTASAMAMAALPQATLPGKGMFALGGGTYGGQSSLAVGISSMSESGKWVVKANATTNTRGNVGAAVGVGFHW